LFKIRHREQKNRNRLKNMTKTEYKEAPEENNLNFSVLQISNKIHLRAKKVDLA